MTDMQLVVDQQRRIEALEAQIAADTIRLEEDTDVMVEATTRIKTQGIRIEALEAALTLCVIELRQTSSTEGDSIWRALKKARAALAPETE